MSRCHKVMQSLVSAHVGNVPDCITHLVNFVVYSGNPKATLATLQQTLPPTIFELLIQVYASLEKKVVGYRSSVLFSNVFCRATSSRKMWTKINTIYYCTCSKIPCRIKCSH